MTTPTVASAVSPLGPFAGPTTSNTPLSMMTIDAINAHLMNLSNNSNNLANLNNMNLNNHNNNNINLGANDNALAMANCLALLTERLNTNQQLMPQLNNQLMMQSAAASLFPYFASFAPPSAPSMNFPPNLQALQSLLPPGLNNPSLSSTLPNIPQLGLPNQTNLSNVLQSLAFSQNPMLFSSNPSMNSSSISAHSANGNISSLSPALASTSSSLSPIINGPSPITSPEVLTNGTHNTTSSTPSPITPQSIFSSPSTPSKSTPSSSGRSSPSTASSSPASAPYTKASQNGSKKRAQWTEELHEVFVEVVNRLGKKAVPSKILHELGRTNLTRAQIASHLQKYREQEKLSESANKGRQKPMNMFVIVDETPSLQKKTKAKRKKLDHAESADSTPTTTTTTTTTTTPTDTNQR
eukprot:TRINITY_DN2911_c0_g2_i1.p1 TRINITY_DN2911_c0_g2~~TRINITY_DN2911_c0_g2_i1.p1  ORF type:complete len:411 (-),score=94.85 TRINITY_DN2911_c0_g2_i1:115-1347(-)